MLVIGVDPGCHGAFVALNKGGLVVHKAVFQEGPHGIDFHAYIEGLRAIRQDVPPQRAVAYVENVHAIFGSSAKATFSFGRNFQLAVDGLMAAGFTYKLVSAKEWQKTFFKSMTPIFKTNSDCRIDTKAMARKACEQFGIEHTMKGSRSRVPHSGLVDALLIAKYGLKQEKKLTEGELLNAD